MLSVTIIPVETEKFQGKFLRNCEINAEIVSHNQIVRIKRSASCVILSVEQCFSVEHATCLLKLWSTT